MSDKTIYTNIFAQNNKYARVHYSFLYYTQSNLNFLILLKGRRNGSFSPCDGHGSNMKFSILDVGILIK